METLCGLCGAKGLKRQLILFQLNLEEAILMCENKECVYPLGVTENSKLIVRRQVSEMSPQGRRKRKKKKQKQREEVVPKLVDSIREMRFLEIYLHWQNVDALCWLHSAMSLVVHNVTLVTSTFSMAQDVNSLLKTVLELFNKAQDLSSASREQAAKVLQEAREKVWSYLQPLLKCKYGVQDSPVDALRLLLRQNGLLSEKTLQIYHWEFSCKACGYQQINKGSKHLVTFPNVEEGFTLQDPVFERPCFKCGAPKQKSKLVYEKMPECVLLHFEQGLRSLEDLSFKGQNGHYIITQMVQYKRTPDHFVCWTKEPRGNRWMEIDDVKLPLCHWTSSFPSIPPSEVHIAVWEKVSHDRVLQFPTMKGSNTREPKKTLPNSREGRSAIENSSRPLSDIDCDVTIAQAGDREKVLLSPTSSSSGSLLPGTARNNQKSHNAQFKLQAGSFEPYIPRKKRLLNASSSHSPVCSKQDPARSPLQPFLTWQDIKEQSEKLSGDDLQSDSGYSSPPSVSSCSSPLSIQSSSGTTLSDCLEDIHVSNDLEKQDANKETVNAVEDKFLQVSDQFAPGVSLSCKAKSRVLSDKTLPEASLSGSCNSIELANKLEELLPECLLGNSKEFSRGDSSVLHMADFEKLSEEQDQFIRDLLAV